MKQLTPRAWPVLILLLVTLPISAQDAEPADPENAPTPTNLLDLLPEDGLGEGLDFWLIMDSPFDEAETFVHWAIQQEGEDVAFTVSQGGGDFGGSTMDTQRLVYNADGHLSVFLATDDWGDGAGSVQTGRIVDGKLLLTMTTTVPGSEPTIEEREIDAQIFVSRVPSDWLPLVFAYHIRSGNTRFEVGVIELPYGDDGVTIIAQQVGRQVVEVQAQQQEAFTFEIQHLSGEKPIDSDEDLPKLHMTVLNDGTIYSTVLVGLGDQIVSRRATEEQVAEQFNLDQAERAGEAIEEE